MPLFWLILLFASAFPTLKFFINGFPTDYAGPRKADGIVSYLRRLSAPSIQQLDTEGDLRIFLKSIGPEIPVFVGFGLKVIDLEELAKKYRTKAWFAVMEMFSDSVMGAFDFDKGPAIVVMRGEFGERSTFYGPFEGWFRLIQNELREFLSTIEWMWGLSIAYSLIFSINTRNIFLLLLIL